MQPRLKSLSIDAGQLRTWTAPLRSGGPDVYYIRLPVSSVNVDRDGDRFSEAGLDRLASQLDKGTIPVFPNHGLDSNGWSNYRFEDAYGVWVKGEIEDGILYGTAALDPDDYRTQVIERKIERGFPVSTSIGFFPLASTPDGDGELFDDAELVEISFVGIPSNREATTAVRAVVKSLLNAAGITVPDDTDIPANLPGGLESDPVTEKELKEKQPDEG
ncbi:hypothetical protein, partial [Methanoculleus sp.]|uniref:hypothetical protein n=1 Tax=Methanoculleus sp. TaxID=90427 RepID=UPI00272ED320